MSFGGFLRQSTAVDVLIGPFVDSADGDTEETALTISQGDVMLSKNGQTAAQKNDNTACAHDADGFYNCELDATDTNTVGQLVLYVHEAGALAVRHDFQVLEEAVYDAMFAASAVGPLLASSNGSGLTEAGGTGDHLTAINLPNQTMDIVGNITGNLSGSVGSVTGAVGSVTGAVGSVTGAVGSVAGNVDGNVTGSIGSLAAQAKADVNAEALDVLNTDTFAEPGQGTPGATVSLAAKIGYLYKAWRNRSTTTATEYALYADDATTKDQEAVLSDDGTTAEKGEVSTGA